MLAGAADRDVTAILGEVREFRQATVGTFNALREDFSDLRTDVDRGFTEMRGKLDATAAGQQRIAELIKDLMANHRQRPARAPMKATAALPEATPRRMPGLGSTR